MDAELHYVFNNARYRDVLGVEPETLRGKAVKSFLSPALYEELSPLFQQALAGERVTREGICYDPQDGRLWSATYIPDIRHGKIVGFFVMSQDVTEQKRTEKALLDRALLDSLTGLPNRAAMNEKLGQAVALAASGAAGFALFFMDLDGFKGVNDQHGHDVGDQLLEQVARRLTAVVRQDDFVCRLAGDEFVVIATGVTSSAIGERIGGNLCAALHRPFDLAKARVVIGTSVGIALCPPLAAATPESILACGDTAMYEAKRQGRNRFQFGAPL